MLLRSWLIFSIAIAILQAVLGLLCSLQHNAVFSDLLRQRLSVIAQTTASSFKPMIDLGLPISMIRNGKAIVGRSLEMDREIRAVHAIDPAGTPVYSTEAVRPPALPQGVTAAMKLAGGVKWSSETSDEIFSGFNVVGRDGGTAGAVVVVYPKSRLEAASRLIAADILQTAVLVWAAFSALAYVVLRLVLAAPQRAVAGLETVAREGAGGPQTLPARVPTGFWRRLFRPEIERLEDNLCQARKTFDEASEAIGAFDTAGSPGPKAAEPPQEGAGEQRQEAQIASSSTRSLARRIASYLAPLAAIFIIASALVLGITILHKVNQSIEPELAARTNLIATAISEDVQRAVAAGVPLEGLVGAESYFGDMLKQMPEVAYAAVATGRIILETGKRIDPYLAPPRERKDVRSHPILQNGKEIAYVVIDVDPAFISKRFLDVFLDMGVVILAAVLISFEVMVLMTSRSMTARLDRLQRLAAMQAVGDFTKRANVASRSAIDRASRVLIDRAEALNRQFAAALRQLGPSAPAQAKLETLRQRYGLSENGPSTLRFSYFTDLRLALFLFAAADELPLSFLPLFTRAAQNPWPWLDRSVLISLPLAGYLVAIVLVSPFARQLAHWRGRRALLIAAAIPTCAAHLGMYLATSVPEIVAARTVMGIGYAIVTLACQDFVLDTTSREERDRSLGMFSMVLFGGIFCGTALGGVMADRLGQANVFLISAAMIAVSALLIIRFVVPTASPSSAIAPRAARLPIVAALRNRRFAALVFGIAIPANVVLQAFISYLVALSLDALGASPADIGRTLMIYFLAIALVGAFAGRVAESGIPVPAIALAGAMLAVVAIATVVVWPSQIAMIVAVLGAGIGAGVVRGAQVSYGMTIAETELSHLGVDPVLGALRTVERAGSIVGLLAIAAVAGQFGYAAATAVVVGWSLAGAALFGLSVAADLTVQPEKSVVHGQ